jgi:hypothetical protein
MTSNLIRWKLDQYPGSIAVWLDPKNSPREDGNFADPRITRLAISGIGMSRAEYAIEVAEQLEIARGFIQKANIEKGKHVFFVFDEIMNIKQKLDKTLFAEVQDLIVDCISMGDDSGIHAIAITQSFNAGESVGSDELMKNMTLIACLKQDEYARSKKIVQFGKTNHDSFSEAEFIRLARKSPRDRVLCVGGTFIPAPEMPLLSGWDRDKGTHVTQDRHSNVDSKVESTFESTAINNDDDPNLADMIEQIATIAATSTGEPRKVAVNTAFTANNALQAGNPEKAIEICKSFLKANV